MILHERSLRHWVSIFLISSKIEFSLPWDNIFPSNHNLLSFFLQKYAHLHPHLHPHLMGAPCTFSLRLWQGFWNFQHSTFQISIFNIEVFNIFLKYSLRLLQIWQYFIFILQHARKLSSTQHAYSFFNEGWNKPSSTSYKLQLASSNLSENPQGAPICKNLLMSIGLVRQSRNVSLCEQHTGIAAEK